MGCPAYGVAYGVDNSYYTCRRCGRTTSTAASRRARPSTIYNMDAVATRLAGDYECSTTSVVVSVIVDSVVTTRGQRRNHASSLGDHVGMLRVNAHTLRPEASLTESD